MRKRFPVSALLVLILSVLVLPAAAGAAPPVSGSGTFTVSSAVTTSTRQADGNTFLTLRVTTLYSGTLQGTGVGEETVIVHPDGTLNGSTFEAFTGTIGGTAGTAVLRVEGTGDVGTGALRGRFTILDGTGGLANVRGEGTFQAVGDSGTYSVMYSL
jgi:Protein of unknown function (DUF3224)